MKTGEILPPVELEVQPEWLHYYYQAVGSSYPASNNSAVPATAIAGKALMELLEPLNLPSGVVHTQAVVESISPANIGDKLFCEGVITSVVKRIGIEAMTVRITVKSSNYRDLLKAEMTFKLPGQQAEQG
ncbi:MAG: hypothetical protein PHY25_04855 [Dehalococcoidales bacterium]|jgi:hypothetical protein|nr:hypothetical protein [Dehalococcoidales bacterium]MDD4465988.1 hypothetical protein [Dehalococcoidales bacterium]